MFRPVHWVPRRGRLLSSVIAATIVAGAVAGLAIASASGGGPSSLPAGPTTLWKWGDGVVPGSAYSASKAVLTSASRAQVDPSSLRAAATASDGLTLLFGKNSSGVLCSADASAAVVSGFTCLSDWSDKFALLLYATDGGSQMDVVDHASVVGVARPDVARVTLTTASGSIQTLPLNAWRGFSYTASTASELPVSMTAYDANGDLLETDPVDTTTPPDS